MERSPCRNQTEAEIGAYYQAAGAGAVAVVRLTHGMTLTYFLAEVEGQLPRGRIAVRNHGSFYARTGRNCFHPKGQTTLVVPTPEVLEWAAANPHGRAFVSCRPETAK
jgi:hypothetical protein